MPRSNPAPPALEPAWKERFLERLNRAQQRCTSRFEVRLDESVEPVFGEFESFLSANGFAARRPLRESGRRSYKFELAENAYVLFIFRFQGVGEFELRSEIFAPGCAPKLESIRASITDLDPGWIRDRFQAALDEFVDLLADENAAQPEPALS